MRGALETPDGGGDDDAAATYGGCAERLRALGYVGSAPSTSASGENLPDPKDKVQVLERRYRAGIAGQGARKGNSLKRC